MDILSFLLNNPFGNILWHILLGIMVGIIIFPNRKKIPTILLWAVLFEGIIDGAHLINPAITHNLFFMLQLPLFIFFIGYAFLNSRRWMNFALLFLANTFSHLISDSAFEGGSLYILYPFSSQAYTWNGSLGFAGIRGALFGVTVLAMVLLVLKVVEMIIQHNYSISISSSWPHRKERRRYNLPSFITTVAFFIFAL